MPVSSNTLFHFVNERRFLEDILNGNFYPRYCLETFGFNFLGFEDMLIPMKCFCDIPLSQISTHTRQYGSFGIGFTKEWAKRKDVTPILYLYENSPTLRILQDTTIEAISRYNDKFPNRDTDSNIEDKYLRELFYSISIIAYIKPYEGYMEREGETVPVKFYNEMEWRFVPKIGITPDNNLQLLKRENADETTLQTFNGRCQRLAKLEYAATDIKYIFVSSEVDRIPIYDIVMSSTQFNPNEKKELVSKILTIEQIEEDF